jgi:hypothetical protein
MSVPAKEVPKRRGGRKPFVPAKDQRDVVALLAGGGLQADRIAGYLQISEATLYRKFAYELQNGKSRMDAVVLTALTKAVQRGEPWAISKYLHQRMWRNGWRDPPQQLAVATHNVNGQEIAGDEPQPAVELNVHFKEPDPSKRPRDLMEITPPRRVGSDHPPRFDASGMQPDAANTSANTAPVSSEASSFDDGVQFVDKPATRTKTSWMS